MKDRLGEFYEKHQKGMSAAIAFLVPFLICFLICVGKKVYPFGDRCILHVDMYHQYCPFFTEFLDKIRSGGNLMYSWTAGLGSDFVALYAYYLASPLNWLIVLCPRSLVIEFMTLLVLAKIGISGWSFNRFLEYRSGEQAGDTGMFRRLVFSTAYAMSGYVAAYSWDIMWMDCVALFPFIALGMLKMIREKKPALYFISLSLSIISNYYLSIMTCIFMVIYFVITEVEEKGGWEGFFRFAGYSLMAGASAAFLLIPELKILGYSGSSGIEHPSMKWYFGLIDELARGVTTAESYTGAEQWPNIYAGAFTLFFVVLYGLNKKIPWKKKLPRLGVAAFFLLSFANSWLDFFWHGLHFPNSLPGRQAYIYIFVLLVLAHEAVRHWDGLELWHFAASIVFWMLILAAAYYTVDEEVADSMAIVITGVFMICYAMFSVMIHVGKEKEKASVRKLMCIMAAGELILHMAITGFSTTSRPLYVEKQESYAKILEKKEKLSDGKFWRVEDTQRKTKSDSGLYDYNSVTQFSSLMNINVSHFYQRMYMEGGKNFYCYNGATPLLSAMLSVKYQISDNGAEEGPLLKKAAEADGTYLYENTYTLPMGFMIPAGVGEAWDANRDKLANINDLSYRLGASEETIREIDTAQAEEAGSTTVTAPQDGYYYASCEDITSDSLEVSNSNGYTKSYSKTTHTYLIGLGYLHEGDTAAITNSNSEEISFTTYILNLNAIDTAYQKLDAQKMELTTFSDTRVEGKIDVTEPGSLFFSIPAEEGWTLYVDGKETPIQSYAEAFISTPLQTGEHQIRLRYRTPGIVTGGIISAGSVGLFVLLMLIRRKKGNREFRGELRKNDGAK